MDLKPISTTPPTSPDEPELPSETPLPDLPSLERELSSKSESELPPEPKPSPPEPKPAMPDLSSYDPIDNPYVSPTSPIPPASVVPNESSPTGSTPAFAEPLPDAAATPNKPRLSPKKRIVAAVATLAIIIGTPVLLSIFGFFAQRETLACTLSDQYYSINMNFHYANGSVNTMDYKFKVNFASPSQAQENLRLAENEFRKEISKQLTGKRDFDMDMQFYTEGSSLIVDIKVSRDLISNIHLVAGTKQTIPISEAKTQIQDQIPGMACAIK